MGFFVADGGGWTMARVDYGVCGQAKKVVSYARYKLGQRTTGEIGTTNGSFEQGIAGKHYARCSQRNTALRVTGGGQYLKGNFSTTDFFISRK